MSLPEPPSTYKKFIAKHPKLADAWGTVAEAGSDGPIDAKTARLIKLGIAIGAMREGSVHASVRKAKSVGITAEELDQVVALAAGTLGFPSTVAIYSWIDEVDD